MLFDLEVSLFICRLYILRGQRELKGEAQGEAHAWGMLGAKKLQNIIAKIVEF